MAKTDTPITADSMDTTNSTPGSATPMAEDDDALRKRLLSRIAVAGVAILGLLGGLAVYDSLNKPQAPAMPKMAAAPAQQEAAVAEKSSDIAVSKAEEETPVPAESVPERTEAPLAPPPESLPKAAKPLTQPATARQAAIKPAAPVAALAKPDTQRELAPVVPEDSHPAAKSRPQARHAPASRPLTQAAESARRFLVQVGVFSNHANAEELVTKLHEAGIPAQIESRVQVGPFASRAEADAARAKLKTLGLDDGLLVRR